MRWRRASSGAGCQSQGTSSPSWRRRRSATICRLSSGAWRPASQSSQPPQVPATGHSATARRGSRLTQRVTRPSPWRAFQMTVASTTSPGNRARGASSSSRRPSASRPTPLPPQARRSTGPCQVSVGAGEFRYAGGTFAFAFLEPDSALRFTVAGPPEHRSILLDRAAGEMRRCLVFVDGGAADVVLGLPGDGTFADCEGWPGLEAAEALVRAAWARLQDRRDMERLHEVGRALASEQNLDRLLDLILTKARELVMAEAGSIYLLTGDEDHPELLFAHTQNARVSLPFARVAMPISREALAGFVALSRESLNLPDVYGISPEAPYRFNDSFDRQAGYRTQSALVVPMLDTEGQVLGVLQLLNRLQEDGQVAPFSP